MKPIRFLISSLLAAGLLPPTAAKATVPQDLGLGGATKDRATLFEVFKLDHVFLLAAHVSHSSHSSHASHSSHQSHTSHMSSSDGGYALPTSPSLSPTVPSPTVGGQTPATLSGNTQKFFDIVFQLQTALYAFGYYSGPITGVVDAATKAAIADMQSQFGMPVTGTITPEVLDALGIVAA